MENERKYFFDNIENLIKYLFAKYGKLSPLKLQKGLYFLFAFYGGTYGIDRKNVEIEYNLPKYLFNARFMAWDYGPVIEDVYFKNRDKAYDDYVKSNVAEISEELFKADFASQEVKMFIDEVFDEVITTSDFNLVDRSHEDEVWKNAYNKGRNSEMPLNEIVKEYQSIDG